MGALLEGKSLEPQQWADAEVKFRTIRQGRPLLDAQEVLLEGWGCLARQTGSQS